MPEPHTITAQEFFEAESRAHLSASDRTEFRRLVDAIGAIPETKQRLAFEIAGLATEAVDRAVEPADLLPWLRAWGEGVSQERLPEFVSSVEELTRRYFHRLRSIHPAEPDLTLPILLLLVRRLAPAQLNALVSELRTDCSSAPHDARVEVLGRAEESI